ncbi:MAG TPA: hypothetical protein VFN18_10610 [Solirubrobacterales bacterium]|nr:hypothetical protein [Solirubrobacterales bacterium]
MRAGLRAGVAAALVLAAASLLLPYHPVYDPWAWLIWGRELAHGGLETAAGPSWKPLPVLACAPLSLLGDAAPAGWLLVARTGWLCAPLLAGLLAARLAGEEAGRWRWTGAALAAGSVALTADSFTPPLRQFTGGLSEPLLVALVLGAVWAALDERRGLALGLGTAAALLRPEAWPFLALYGLSVRGHHPRLRVATVLVAVLIPLAWFVPDIVGAGNPLEGGETARAGGLEPLDGLAVLGRALAAPLAAAWIGLALLLWQGDFVNQWFAKSPRAADPDRPLAILLAGALAWILLVAAMAIAGFAGLPRFLAPATAVIAVLGGVGLARTAGCGRALGRIATQSSTTPWDSALRALVAATLVIAVAGFAWRAAQVPGDVEVVERQTRSVDHLFDLVDATGAEELLACQDRVRMTHVREQTALAWKLDEPIASVPIRYRPKYGIAVSTKPIPQGNVIAHAGSWRATNLPCPANGGRAEGR